MKIKTWMTPLVCLLMLAVLTVTPVLTGCGGDDTPTTTVATSTGVDEFEVLCDAVEAYLDDPAANIKASDLQMMIAEGNAPYIASLRSADDYANGHIPGAVNMAFSEITTLPENEDILVYCYTGQTASYASAVLGVLGYDVQNLLHGMSSWSDDPAVYVSRFDPATSQGDYYIETMVNDWGTHSYPKLDYTTSEDEDDIILAAAKTVSPKYITASDLNMKIAEQEGMSVVSLRSAEDYAKGHIQGAVNIEFSNLVRSLSKINSSDPVYVYCYTGHTAAQAAAVLQMLGYDAYSLKFGMCSWSSDPDINAGKCFDSSTVAGYDTE